MERYLGDIKAKGNISIVVDQKEWAREKDLTIYYNVYEIHNELNIFKIRGAPVPVPNITIEDGDGGMAAVNEAYVI